ncbi:hypothetical protein LUZ60_000286 [Juncus effusus]|nr:hypothetical protein LUZ60_000286 [Juncus effusus]
MGTSAMFFLLSSLFLFSLLTSTITAFTIPDQLPRSHSLSNPWLPFRNLSGCQIGEERHGLSDLKKYLNNFGYLPPPLNTSNYTDSFDSDFQSALLSYQHNLGLNNTGYLDPNTIEQMMLPRCGVADVINASYTHGRNLYTYFAGNPTWPSTSRNLKYALITTSASSIDISTLKTVFARAFSRWSAAIPVNFTETESQSDADITIGFYTGSHGDDEPFDGPLGTLAHAFSPTDGRFHLDASETWVATGDVSKSSSDDAIDLESVAVHEIGHLLGLGHSSVAEAIMYPTLTIKTRKVNLVEDDVAGVQLLYGSNPAFKGVAPAGVAGEMDSSDGVIVTTQCWLGLWLVAALFVMTLL